MRFLVIGQAGREHALVWKLAQSPLATQVYCAPGNAGTAIDGVNVPIAENDHREIVHFCKREKIDLVVIGPEAPLVAGLADDLRQAGILVFGPSKAAAELEGSKAFCKRLLRREGVPSSDFHVFRDLAGVQNFLQARPGPCVVKADGLAAGKGVVVCDDTAAALAAAQRMLEAGELGPAGQSILIEERLHGEEVSVLAITDGATLLVLDACQDHKRAFDGDRGPNTGGMGAYCPTPLITAPLLAEVEQKILIPVLHALKVERRPFQGVLYAGLMLTSAGPKVLEFNVRFGDPECQPLLLRLRSDLAAMLLAAANGRLRAVTAEWDPRPAVCVVMASGGYPSIYKKGLPIRGLEEVAAALPDVKVFHAGTKQDDGRIVTAGGRVLGVTALGADLGAARARAYAAVDHVKFTGAMVRRDIAARALGIVESGQAADGGRASPPAATPP